MDVDAGSARLNRPGVREDLLFEVVTNELRTPVITELVLQPATDRIDYLPGQYLLVGDVDYERPVRSYSIANSPRTDGTVSLLVTLVTTGETSSWLHRVEPGEELLLSGPYGTFVAEPETSDPVLYLAGGSGLAPIRALIEAALGSARPPSMTLVFSARAPNDLIDHDRLRQWDADHPEFHYARTLTRADGPPPIGHIPDILEGLVPTLDRHRVYVAGGSGFVAACAEAARRHGAAPGRVFTEEFFVDPQPWGAARAGSDGR